MINRKSKSKQKGGVEFGDREIDDSTGEILVFDALWLSESVFLQINVPKKIQQFYEIMEQMPTTWNFLNRFFDARDKKIIADKKNGRNVDDMEVLESMLNILNILFEEANLDPNVNTTQRMPEHEGIMVEALRKDIIALLLTMREESSSRFHYHKGVKCETVD